MATRSEKNRILVAKVEGIEGKQGPPGPMGPQGESGIFGFEVVGDDLILTYETPSPPAMSIDAEGNLIYSF